MKEENKKGKVKSYIYYIIVLVAVLVISTISVAYAYISALNNNAKTANTAVTGKTDCIDIQLDANGSATGLTYNYPITDTFALQSNHVQPVTIKLTNKCSTGQGAIDYTVALSALSNTSATYIPDTKIKIKAVKNTGTDTNVFDTKLLSAVTKIGSTKTTYNLLNSTLSANEKTKGYTTKTHYLIEKSTLASGASITYKVYLWIDYAEGSSNNSTKGQSFASILSAVVNNPETF